MSTTRRSALALVALLAAVSLGLAACSSSKSSSSTTKSGGLVIEDAWARTSAMSTGAGAVYLSIENTTDKVEKLLSASVPTSVAKTAQIHETVMGNPSTSMPMDGSHDTMAGSGMMSMREVTSVTIPAGGTVALEPGGYHIMLLDLAAPLKAGEKFTLSLGFMNAAVVQVEVTVKDS